MLTKSSSFLAFLLGLGNFSMAHADSCRFENIEVKPMLAGKYDVFQAKTRHLDIRCSSTANDAHVDAFPEPPLQIINSKTSTDTSTNTQCAINGGIWVRKDVFVSQDEHILITHEYSGSNDFLMFYKTDDCSKVQEIDVSYAHWKIRANTLRVEPVKTDGKNKAAQNYRFDAACKATPVGK